MFAQQDSRTPLESKSIRELVAEIVDENDVELWLQTENVNLGGKKPSCLIDTDREWLVRELIEQIRQGVFT